VKVGIIFESEQITGIEGFSKDEIAPFDIATKLGKSAAGALVNAMDGNERRPITVTGFDYGVECAKEIKRNLPGRSTVLQRY